MVNLARRLTLILLAALIQPGRTFAEPPDDPPRRYEAAIAALDDFAAGEVAEKKLPSLSIALVEGQALVWSKGYGFADPARTVPTSGDTIYRAGSISKLFTDVAIMQLVEEGKVDLDVPVRTYLPGFAPKNPFGDEAITLGQLMAHRSGLALEPPVGNDFDPSPASLEATVASLNNSELLFKPGSRSKYSNAAVATAGLVLEKIDGQPFKAVVTRRVLAPLGMTRSRFDAPPASERDVAEGLMWTYHGREFPAPRFELGMVPAGSLYSSANDLARFVSALLAGRLGEKGSILRRSILDEIEMQDFRSTRTSEDRGLGLGIAVSRFQGGFRIDHAGGIYGFAAELAAIPSEKLGVVVMTSRDGANSVTKGIADYALELMLAVRKGKPLPPIETTIPLDRGRAKRLAGHYQGRGGSFELSESADRLWMERGQGGVRVEVRGSGLDLLVDDVLAFGPRLLLEDKRLRLGSDLYERVPVALPPEPPARFLDLIGEYGWDHEVLYVLEKEGKLHALIGWFACYPLKEVSENVFEFPDFGVYRNERLIFRRDPAGRSTEVTAANVVFKRRHLDGENGQTFRIKPTRPVEAIRRGIDGLKPPVEPDKRKPDLVDLTAIVPGIKLEIRYASSNNFLGEPLYTSARALMQRPAAGALAKVQARLAAQGHGLLIHDAYRPWRVTKLFWEATPEAQHTFVADPAKGSRHNRGCAVDLTLCDLASGRPIEMVSGYDEFSDRAYPNYPGGTARQRWHRDLLKAVMEDEGFTVNEAEWWHFDFNTWRDYPILDVRFEDL